jgi:beta-N-acetylhexosaminidase
VVPQLAAAVRRHHPAVDEFILPHAPADGDIAALLPRLAEYDAIVLGTIDALHQPAQAALARAVLSANPRTVVVALRLPYDLSAFPEASTCICTYSILEPSMRAAADALFGMRGFEGKLPVTLPEPDSA